MMAVVASFTNNQLSIVGDSAADTVVVSTVDVGGVAQVTVNGQGFGSGVNASAVTSIFANLGAGNDTMNLSTLDLTKFSGLTDGSIEIRGGAGNDTLVGSPLADVLKGEDGNDTLNGGAGNDTLIGGNGNDTLIGGAGDDILDGGAGDDMYSFSGSTDLGSDTVVQATSGNLDTLGFGSFGGAIVVDISMTTPQVVRAGQLTLTLSDGAGIDNVQGTAYDDVILGNTGGNSLMGNGGKDYLWGRGGNDWLDGGAGNDTLYGGDGNDTLLGKGGNDSLYGHAGDDTLNGNEGNDYLSGDEGDDAYVVTNYGTKTIGAAASTDNDRLDLAGQPLAAPLDLSSTSAQAITSSLSVRFTDPNSIRWIPGAGDNGEHAGGLYEAGYYTVPGLEGTTTTVEFIYGGEIAAYNNSVYVYDATSNPSNPTGTFLFVANSPNPPKTLTFPAGHKLGFYILQNNVDGMNGNASTRFYADDAMNVNDDDPGAHSHVHGYDLEPGLLQLSWEDLFYQRPNPLGFIQDTDFNDLYIGVRVIPKVNVSVAPAIVAEDSSEGLVFTFSRTGLLDGPLDVVYSLGGSAAVGDDYFGVSSGFTIQTARIPSGQSSETVTIFPNADDEIEPDETVDFRILENSAYTIGVWGEASGTIADDDRVVVTIQAPDPEADEVMEAPGVARTGTLRLVRTGNLTNSLLVKVDIGGDATYSGLFKDYTLTNVASGFTGYFVTIPENSPSIELVVTPLQDSSNENTETVVVTVEDYTGYELGEPTTQSGTVEILDAPSISSVSITYRIDGYSRGELYARAYEVETNPQLLPPGGTGTLWTGEPYIFSLIDLGAERIDGLMWEIGWELDVPQMTDTATYPVASGSGIDALRTFSVLADEGGNRDRWYVKYWVDANRDGEQLGSELSKTGNFAKVEQNRKPLWVLQLQDERESHVGTIYNSAWGITDFFDELIAAASNVTYGRKTDEGAQANYSYFSDRIFVTDATNVEGGIGTIIHESTHALDDARNWTPLLTPTVFQIDGVEAAAWTVQGLLDRDGPLKSIRRFEALLNAQNPDVDELRVKWRNCVIDLQYFPDSVSVGLPSGPRVGTYNDVQTAMDVTGLFFNMTALMENYQQVLTGAGVEFTLASHVENGPDSWDIPEVFLEP